MASKHKGKYHVVIFLCHSCFYSTYTFVPYIISLFQLPIISFHLIRLSLLYMQEGNIWWCKQKKDIVARIYFPLCDLLLRYDHETKRYLTLVSLPRLIVISYLSDYATFLESIPGRNILSNIETYDRISLISLRM